jgi:hypothetical protein
MRKYCLWSGRLCPLIFVFLILLSHLFDRSFGELIAQLFHGSSRSFSPSDFKRTIARFAPSFSGYQQHDSQEVR